MTPNPWTTPHHPADGPAWQDPPAPLTAPEWNTPPTPAPVEWVTGLPDTPHGILDHLGTHPDEVRCHDCNALPGAVCINPAGVSEPHPARVETARWHDPLDVGGRP